MKNHRPVLDEQACVACGRCVLVCASMVLELREGRPHIARPDWCNACLHCASVCATHAITVPPFQVQASPSKGARPAVDPEALMLLLRERRSIRRYTRDPVPHETLERLIQAGRYAPTGTNAQNLSWIVFATQPSVEALRDRVYAFYARLFKTVQNPMGRLGLRMMAGAETVATLLDYLPVAQEADKRLAQGDDRLTHHATALLLVHGPSGDTCSAFNGAVALYHASLLAHSLGLGCCFNGFIENAVNNDKSIKSYLEIPKGNRCYGAMGLGFTDPRARYTNLPDRLEPPVQWR